MDRFGAGVGKRDRSPPNPELSQSSPGSRQAPPKRGPDTAPPEPGARQGVGSAASWPLSLPRTRSPVEEGTPPGGGGAAGQSSTSPCPRTVTESAVRQACLPGGEGRRWKLGGSWSQRWKWRAGTVPHPTLDTLSQQHWHLRGLSRHHNVREQVRGVSAPLTAGLSA